jgi:hypothetical protein
VLTEESLRQVGEHDRCQDRQQPLNQTTCLAPEVAAQGLRNLILIGTEDVADDLLTVISVHLAKIDSTVHQLARVIAESAGQRSGAGRICSVGLHPAKQGGDRLTSRLLGGCLINSQLRGELVHRNVGQDVVYCTHR